MEQWGWLVLAIFVSGALGVQEMDDPIGFKNETWDRCRKQEHVPEGAMIDLYHFRSVEGIKDHKCVAKCILEAYKILREDGTISKKMIVIGIKGVWKDPQLQQKLITAGAVCVDEDVPVPDLCEYSYDIIACFVEILKKEGVMA